MHMTLYARVNICMIASTAESKIKKSTDISNIQLLLNLHLGIYWLCSHTYQAKAQRRNTKMPFIGSLHYSTLTSDNPDL